MRIYSEKASLPLCSLDAPSQDLFGNFRRDSQGLLPQELPRRCQFLLQFRLKFAHHPGDFALGLVGDHLGGLGALFLEIALLAHGLHLGGPDLLLVRGHAPVDRLLNGFDLFLGLVQDFLPAVKDAQDRLVEHLIENPDQKEKQDKLDEYRVIDVDHLPTTLSLALSMQAQKNRANYEFTRFGTETHPFGSMTAARSKDATNLSE